tara:strand:- start:4996 stop:5316 length:321 start_codon:yes stop_codon:yes gene_type:complete
MFSEPRKRDTKEQLLVSKWLNEIGLEHSLEEEFPPYWADIYIHDIKLVIELDGAYHLKKRDAERDRHLLDEYGVCTWRVDNSVVMVRNKESFIQELMILVEERSNA